MSTCRSIVVAVAITALSGSAFAQKISYDYNRRADFSHLRTFAFRETPPIDQGASETTLYDAPLVKDRTEAAVARQLEARGLKQVDEHPDVYITTRRTFQTQSLVYGPSGWWGYGPYGGYGYGYRYGYGYYGGPWYSVPYVVGTLTVDVTRPDGELLWRGISQAEAHEHTKPAERTEHVDKEVSKMFRRFPSTAGAVATTGHEVPRPR